MIEATAQRISIEDTIHRAIRKIAMDTVDGHARVVDAAETILGACVRIAASVDPDDELGGPGMLLVLDSHGLYGRLVVDLWARCGRDPVRFVTVVRAMRRWSPQVGEDVVRALRGAGAIDVDSIVASIVAHSGPLPEPVVDQHATDGTVYSRVEEGIKRLLEDPNHERHMAQGKHRKG